VESTGPNPKITRPEDLGLVAFLLDQSSGIHHQPSGNP